MNLCGILRRSLLVVAGAWAGVACGPGAKRNWWAAAKDVVRVTKGKGIIVSGGGPGETELRAPKDVGNLITFLDLPQNLAHDASTTTPKALVLRAQTRKTYRAVFSEPRVVIPGQTGEAQPGKSAPASVPTAPAAQPADAASEAPTTAATNGATNLAGKKRPREEGERGTAASTDGQPDAAEGRKKKKKRDKAK